MKTPKRGEGRSVRRAGWGVAAGWAAWMTAWLLLPARLEAASEARSVRRLFADPPREYASAPLWVWNDLLTEEQIRGTMRDLAGQRVRQVFVHPRPGLMTPYLGADWFRLWKAALDEAGRLDMNVWIYDENSYPSGFAGGWVPEEMPESRGQGLELKEAAEAPAWSGELVSVHRVGESGVEDVAGAVREGRAGAGPFLVGRVVRAGNSPWHGDRCYVNLLTPGVAEKFLDVTLGAYEREVGGEFGRRIPGVFTDEPNIRPAGGFPWCDDLAVQFEKRRGYSLVAQLPGLVREAGDWRRVRHDYYRTLNELFLERWAKPYYEACDRRGLEFTGHYWDHEWPHCVGVPDNMAMAAWQHRPGVDTLMNQYAENTHAQFGNVRYCREISSIANQLGRERTLVELYGAGGWDLRFEDMKRIADWLQVLGVNTMDEHLSYVTLRGARKRDHPQSFSYHEPWWPAYHVHADYMARLSAVLSQGKQVNPVLVIEPTTTAWMYQGNEPRLKALGDGFFRLLMSLESAQIEYDLGCEDVIGRHGGITSGPGVPGGWASAAALKVGQRNYPVVIVPAETESLTARTRELLNDFALAGGQVLCAGALPARTDGREDPDAYASPTLQRRWRSMPAEALLKELRDWTAGADLVVDRADGDRGILFHHRRRLDEGQILFLVNSSREHPSRGGVRGRFEGVERWDPYTGKTGVYPHRRTVSGISAEFELPPSGSLLLYLPRTVRREREAVVMNAPVAVPPAGTPDVRRVGPNVLTLDYVDVTVGGETVRDQYFYAANRRVWKAHGRERNPWDSAVQFKGELISQSFPEGSGFEVSYRFTVEGPVPADLALAVERPDLYTITCNGSPVAARVARRTRVDGTPGTGQAGETVEFADWWRDRAFGRLSLQGLARTGENVVTLKAAPFTMWHEIEPAYLLGSFRLRAAGRGWVVEPDAPLRGPGGETGEGSRERLAWNAQGHPFHADGVTYRQAFDVADRTGRFEVTLPDWYGSVARVVVNGKEAGWITAPPWSCDVGDQIRRGSNVVEVTVVGTLKNTLGPHHGRHALGSAWPGMFQNGPNPGPPAGGEYSTVAYGMLRPMVLTRATERKP